MGELEQRRERLLGERCQGGGDEGGVVVAVDAAAAFLPFVGGGGQSKQVPVQLQLPQALEPPKLLGQAPEPVPGQPGLLERRQPPDGGRELAQPVARQRQRPQRASELPDPVGQRLQRAAVRPQPP